METSISIVKSKVPFRIKLLAVVENTFQKKLGQEQQKTMWVMCWSVCRAALSSSGSQRTGAEPDWLLEDRIHPGQLTSSPSQSKHIHIPHCERFQFHFWESVFLCGVLHVLSVHGLHRSSLQKAINNLCLMLSRDSELSGGVDVAVSLSVCPVGGEYFKDVGSLRYKVKQRVIL